MQVYSLLTKLPTAALKNSTSISALPSLVLQALDTCRGKQKARECVKLGPLPQTFCTPNQNTHRLQKMGAGGQEYVPAFPKSPHLFSTVSQEVCLPEGSTLPPMQTQNRRGTKGEEEELIYPRRRMRGLPITPLFP